MSLFNLLYMISLLYFGTITIWYLHLYDVCDKLFVSFIDKPPLILLFLSCQAMFIVSLEAFYFQRSKLDSFTTRITRGQWSQLSKLALFYFFGNKRVSFLLVVKYNYLFIILFPLLLLYNVVKKEGASMFVRVIKNNKGKKNTCFCALVESYRDSSGVPKHRVLINFGQVDEESVPFLKAAFAKKKPRLVYDDE